MNKITNLMIILFFLLINLSIVFAEETVECDKGRCFTNQQIECFYIWLLPFIVLFISLTALSYFRYKDKVHSLKTIHKVLISIGLLILFYLISFALVKLIIIKYCP